MGIIMKGKILILTCLILLIVSMASVSAADDVNQTISDDTLSVSQDIDVISEKDDGTFTALQEKIKDAPSYSTITLENDYTYNDGFNTKGIEIPKGLTIDGNGHVINALNKSRIFQIGNSADNVIFKNIGFINGNYYNGDSAIYYWDNAGSHSKLTVVGCSFVNCSYESSGSAIGVHGVDIKISDCIMNNAPIYIYDPCNVDIFNCTFINNSGYNAGAIYMNWGPGDYVMNINKCSFIENAALRGGAIKLGAYIDYNIVDCDFIGNIAECGGAIYIAESCKNLKITGCNFISNAALEGGAIYIEELIPSIVIDNCGFENNLVNDDGGAVYFSKTICYSIYPFSESITKFSNLLFDDNAPNDYGGGISFSDNCLSIQGNNSNRYISGDVSVNVAGKTLKKTFDSQGIADFDLNSIPEGTWNAKISYGGGSNFDPFEITLPLTVVSSTKLDVPDVTKDYGGPERLEVTLTESGSPVANANVNININGVNYSKTTDSNGKTSMALNLNAGSYNATVTYKDISAVAKVTINQLTTTNTLSYTKNSHNSVTLTASVNPATATGDVVFTVNGNDYNAKISNGKATYALSGLNIGSYEAKATYGGDVNHKASVSNSVKFTVEEVKYDVSAPDLTKYYHGPERFVVTVKEDGKAVAGKDVTINLNGANYTKTTNENGEASMAINLNSGEYKVTSEFEGIEVQSTITVKQTVSGENITKIFRNGTQYYATFVDTSGKTLAENTAVEFNINGVFYTRYTNDKGVARMNINLNPGEYVITAKNPSSTEQYTNIITVLPSIVENHDLTKYYRNASQYSLRLLDDKGNPVKAGVEITLNINGVFYKRISNDDGYVKMNINLEPGEYIITADYNGLMASNTIKVLSVIETHDLSMKYKDGSKFEARILDGQGNPYAGQTVTFNINGVFYERITDEEGIARLAINLMAGEYIITSSYNGLNAANTVTVSS